MPGRYEYLENNLSVLEAIGLAGDLTINGKRNDIRLIRVQENKKILMTIDITKSDFLSDENAFQIQSGDILIVNPNNSRVKNAGIISNTGNFISLLSFILSTVLLIRSTS